MATAVIYIYIYIKAIVFKFIVCSPGCVTLKQTELYRINILELIWFETI